VIVVVLIPFLAGAVVGAFIGAGRTVCRAWRDSGRDGAWTLAALASSWVLEDPPGWGAAMRAEFGSVEGRGARWQFAFGCLRTALLPTRRLRAHRRFVAGVVTCGLVVCTALEVYGRVHYPTETAGGAGYGALFVAFLVVGAWLALRGCQRSGAESTVARRYGTAGGVVAGVMYVIAVTPLHGGEYAALLGVAGAIAAGAMASRASGGYRSAVWAGLWVGLISGVIFFVGLMTLTYTAAGWWTHDHEAVSAFNNFGPVAQHGHQLAQWPGFAAYLVRRESAVALLVGFIVAPLLAIAASTVGGAIGVRRQHSARLTTGPA
jgi:hypothetical protein